MKSLYNPPRVIKNLFKSFRWESRSKILLTFDDGPTTTATEKILTFLDQKKIKAIFFCVGNNIKKNQSLCNEIINAGHTVGNHTFNHQIITKINSSEAKEEISLFNTLLEEKHNYKVKYFRPPHGRFNFSTRKITDELNLQNIMWSLLTYDYKNDLNVVKFAVDNYLNKNSIVVMHDSIKSEKIIIDSIKYLLGKAEEKGFEIGEPQECLK